MIVDNNITEISKIWILPAVISVNSRVNFKNGTKESNKLLFTLIIKAIMPAKKEIKVSGVKALWASLKVLHLLAIAIHKPLIKKEYAMITIRAKINLALGNMRFTPS